MSANNNKLQSMDVSYGDEITTDSSQYHIRCFGCCCDFRKAVIAANATMLVIQIIMMIVIAVGAKMMSGQAIQDALDDDQAKEAAQQFENSGGAMVGFMEVIIFIGVIFTALGIFGAIKFNKCALITTSVFYSLSVVGNIISFNNSAPGLSLVNILFPCLFLYPHVMYLILMSKGVMTPQNYPSIEKCC